MQLPYTIAAAVTPSDVTVLDCRGFYVGGAGNVAIVPLEGGPAVTFTATPVGVIQNVGAKRINATNTTATLIIALW